MMVRVTQFLGPPAGGNLPSVRDACGEQVVPAPMIEMVRGACMGHSPPHASVHGPFP